jgi:predicted nucleic acid-binding protein
MKHVFVETNFLIELLRPFPSKDAERLFACNDGVNLRLYIPWCSQSEAWRTLKDRIINEDLGFTTAMMKFAVRRWLADKTSHRSLARRCRAHATSLQGEVAQAL